MLLLPQERTRSAHCHARIASEKSGNEGNKGNQKSYNKNYKSHRNNSGQGKPQVDLYETCEDVVVLSEVNLAENQVEWIFDIGGMRHISANKDLFKELKNFVHGSEDIYMENSSEVWVHDKANVSLKLNSGKTLALENMLYVLDVRKNIISGALSNNVGVKLYFDSTKLVLLKKFGHFVGKGFFNGGLFILNVKMNESSSSAYIIESVGSWNSRLGHVNIKSIKCMYSMNLIPKLAMSKCKNVKCVLRLSIIRNLLRK